MSDLDNLVVITSVGTVHVLDGSYPPTDAYEIGLLNLAGGQELAIPVTHEQAEAILSLYVSSLGIEAEDAQEADAGGEGPAIAGGTKKSGNNNAAGASGTGNNAVSVQEL